MQARRTRTIVVGSVLASVVVVVAWFPASSLLADHRALATVTTQLDTLRRQERALVQEKARLSQPSEIERIARQQYQMVDPGQQEYQVLPKSTSGSGGDFRGDPGLQGPVAPSGTAELPPGTLTDGPGGPLATAGAQSGSRAASPSLAGRILQTLEFWR